MKSKWKWVYNPFERIAGWSALVIGVVVMALTAVIGKLNRVAFDGVLYAHAGASFSFLTSFAMRAINFLALFLTMWVAGILFSKSKVRAVDVAGTMALAHIPILLFAVICFLPVIPAGLYDIPRIIIFSIIYILFAIWVIALMYNAYSVSCNLKGTKAVVSFIVALLVAEIISKLVIIFLLSGLFTHSPAMNVSENNLTKDPVVVTDSLSIRQKTKNVVKSFEQGNYKDITVYFDSTMRKGLSSEGLKLAWIQTSMTCGPFEKANLDSLKETHVDKYDVIEVPFSFQKENLNLRLAFNGKGEISGLFFVPINK